MDAVEKAIATEMKHYRYDGVVRAEFCVKSHGRYIMSLYVDRDLICEKYVHLDNDQPPLIIRSYHMEEVYDMVEALDSEFVNLVDAWMKQLPDMLEPQCVTQIKPVN